MSASIHHSQPAPISFLREREILARFPVSRAHWWAGVRSGQYPQPVKLSKAITAWRSDEIEALFQRLVAGSAS
ncbi:MAG: AlpA family phage regulatory protein [Burkholderiaceae bacterium]|nr:AlpA family phage regulatory protein [Burkholderiaceae bacterium]